MRVASAPVSWGITEVAGLTADVPYGEVLDEIARAGYGGTELGPWGYLPTAPETLRADLAARDLALVGAFVDVPIHDATLFAEGRAAVAQVVPLLAALQAPVLILSARQTPDRAAIAGRVGPGDGLSAAQWAAAGPYLAELAQRARDAGLDAVFHHHCGTYVETPDEIAALAERVDPNLLGLCLDTGHLVYGGGDPAAFLATYGPAIRHVHLKNVDAAVVEHVRRAPLSYVEAVRAGVFCPLEAGLIDIPTTIAALRAEGYGGWLVVEQDVDRSVAGYPEPLAGATRARTFLQAAAGV